MAADALRALEFPELIRLIGRYISNPLGHAGLAELRPSGDRALIAQRLGLTHEAREYIRSEQAAASASDSARTLPLPLSGFGDPSDLLDQLAVEGSALELP